MAKSKIVADVKPRMADSVYVAAPFDVALSVLGEAGYEPISLRENARLRMREGPEAYISQNGNLVREGVLYLPDGGVRLTKNNPILDNAADATNAHRGGGWYYVTDEQMNRTLENSVSLRGGAIPTDRFGSDERTVFMFGNLAEDYGYWLSEQKINGEGINEMPILLASTKDRAFVNPAWFGSLGGRSDLSGGGGLNIFYLMRGVPRRA